MKRFILNGESIKIFDDEQSLVKFLGSEKSRSKDISYYKITVAEVEVLSESDAKSYLKSYIESTDRQSKVDAVLGDDFSQKVEKFKSMFNDLAKDDPEKSKFMVKLGTTPLDKKSYSKLFTSNAGYLFSVSDSVEWYKVILSIHGFRKMEDSYTREVFFSNGMSQLRSMKVSESSKSNFALARMK